MFCYQKNNSQSLGKSGVLALAASSSGRAIVILTMLATYGTLAINTAQAQTISQSRICNSHNLDNLETSESLLSSLDNNAGNKQHNYRCGFNSHNILEPQAYIDSLLRAQANFFTQSNSFANNLQELQVDLPSVSNYNYFADNGFNIALVYGIPRQQDLRSYVGGIFILPDSSDNIISSNANDRRASVNLPANSSATMITKVTILCVANHPSNTQPAPPLIRDNQVVCGEQTTEVYNYQ